MTRFRCSVGLALVFAATAEAEPVPRVVIGTKLQVESPALPTYLTIPPRVVEPVRPEPKPLPAEVVGSTDPIADLILAGAALERERAASIEPTPPVRSESVEVHAAAPVAVVPSHMSGDSNEFLHSVVYALGGLVALLTGTLIAGVVFLRRPAPAVHVQVVGPATSNYPLALALDIGRVAEQAPIPNFILGPSYEDEQAELSDAADRHAAALLERIAEDNVALRNQLEHEPAAG